MLFRASSSPNDSRHVLFSGGKDRNYSRKFQIFGKKFTQMWQNICFFGEKVLILPRNQKNMDEIREEINDLRKQVYRLQRNQTVHLINIIILTAGFVLLAIFCM